MRVTLSNIALILVIVIGVSAGVFFMRNLSHEQNETPSMVIRDSIRITEQKINIHQDSVKYWNEQHEKYIAKGDSIHRLDSTSFAALRESYRTRIREQIRAGAAR